MTKTRIITETTVSMTAGVHQTLQDHPELAARILDNLVRHLTGDWGDLHAEDWAVNDAAVQDRGYLLSSYSLDTPQTVTTLFGPLTEDKVWIITDDRWATTTVLWPIER